MDPGQPGELDIFFTAADFVSDIEIDVDLPDQETDVQMLPCAVPVEVQNDSLDDAEDMVIDDELPQVSEDEEPATIVLDRADLLIYQMLTRSYS